MNTKNFLFGLILTLTTIIAFAGCNTTVKYDINFIVDNAVISTISTAGNEIIQMPQNPTKDYYTFDGWFWDNNEWQRPFTMNSILNEPLSSNMNVYAKWTANKYSITYDLDGGTLNSPTNSFTVESLPYALPSPTRNGYIFEGWQDLDTNEYISQITMSDVRAYNLKAIWTSKTITSNVVFENATYTYDGTEKTLVATNIPNNVVVQYSTNKLTNVGSINVSATFYYKNEMIETRVATLTITKATYDLSNISFENATYVYDGQAKELVITGTLPSGVTVMYQNNKLTNVGSITATAIFSGDNQNYNAIASMTATLTIIKASYDLSNVSFNDAVYTYDGTAKSIYVTGTLPQEVTVSYENNGKINAGEYIVVAKFTSTNSDFNNIPNMSATLYINKATYDMSGVSFNDMETTYDGTTKYLLISGSLPNGVSVAYENNYQKNAGVYLVKANFTGNSNYNVIPSQSATLKINKATSPNVEFTGITQTYNGQIPKIAIKTQLPSEIQVSYDYGNLSKNVGNYPVTASFNVGNNYTYIAPITVYVNITKADITFTANNLSSVYGQTIKNLTYTTIGVNYDSNFVPTLTKQSGTNVGTYTISITAVNSNYNITLNNGTYTITKATYDLSNVSFNNVSYVYDGTEKSVMIKGQLPSGVNVYYQNNTLTYVGSTVATATFTYDTANYNAIKDMTATLTITKATYNMSGITFQSASYVYDGTEKSIEISGNLPNGLIVYYENNTLTNVGSITAKAIFINNNSNYNDVADKTATLVITKATYDMSNIAFNNATFTYDGNEKEIRITGILPAGVSVDYTNNKLTNAGSVTAKATFTSDNANNYYAIPAKTAILTIEKANFDMSGISFEDVEYTYDGTQKTLEITGSLPSGVNVSYVNNTRTNAGTSKATANFSHNSQNHNSIPSMTANLVINKAEYDISGIAFQSASFVYDGTEKKIEISGTLPQGVGISYSNNTRTIAGTSSAIASFVYDTENYKTLNNLTATLTITKATYDMSAIAFENATYTYDGTEKSIEINGSLPDGVSVNYANNGKINVGTYQITASFTGDATNYKAIANMTATLIIEKATPIITPYYTGDITTNSTITLFYDEEIEGTLIFDDNQTLVVGVNNYTWTFTPNDTYNYNSLTGSISIIVKAIVNFYNDGILFNTDLVEKDGYTSAPSIIPTKLDYMGYAYTFSHWSISQDGEAFDFDTQIENNTNLYAVYTSAIVTYSITYYNTKDISHSNIASYTVLSETFTLENLECIGYNFDGWYCDENYNNKITQIDLGTYGNLNIYAKWTAIQYTITYISEYESENTNPTTYTIEDEIILSNLPNIAHYDFVGWYKEDTFDTQITQIDLGTYGNIDIYAKWEYTEYLYIYTYIDLLLVNNNLNDKYKLMANIDLNGTTWSPYGTTGTDTYTAFTGYFDGNRFTISNFVLSNVKYAGFFAEIAENAMVCNLNLDGVTLNNSISTHAGALTSINRGTINNCSAINISIISKGGSSENIHVGGLVGYNYGEIHYSHANGKVLSSYSYSGGLVGRMENDGKNGEITNSYATGSVTSTATYSYSYAGGLVGYMRNGEITNSYATGSVTSTATATATDSYSSLAGGLVGYMGNGEITNSYATGSVTSTATATTAHSYAGGLVGRIYLATISNSYATGSVTSTSTYSSRAGGLVGYMGDSGKNVEITNSYATGSVTSTSTYSSSAGGLVGHIYLVTISNSYATGNVTATTTSTSTSKYSYSNAGGLVGGCLGGETISNCYATGSVTSTSTSTSIYQYSYAGGLVGRGGRTISNCYATGNVTSTATATDSYSYAGGLVGYMGNGEITNSYATGSVTSTATDSSSAGGLVGYYVETENNVKISNCYKYSGQVIKRNDSVVADNSYGVSASMQSIWVFVYANFDSTIWNVYLDQNPTLKI